MNLMNGPQIPRDAPRVGIIVLNWNRLDETIACLESVETLEYPAYEVVVVDNGSTDGSPATIRQRFPAVPLIENRRNLGFAAGNNVGIARLMERGVDYLFLLNNDTEVAADLLRILVDAGERDARVGMLGPTIYYQDPAHVIWSAGGTVDRYGVSRHLHADQSEAVVSESGQRVDYVTGCAILVKRAVVEAVGVLDERFFMYFEETEWCARARAAGFHVAHVPAARLWHKIMPTSRTYSRTYLYLMARNRLLYLRCRGASPLVIFVALVDLLRTAASWSYRSKHHDKRAVSGALVLGVRDFALGRFGAPPALP
ncbi:MAG TPA: glycosyltransferase family 2 protein [Chloroflexota bacterium]|nr:glycosyltransferase family 2 protein [Chloroflexota bacterium]